ncbi:hypothetical protein CAEBREN_12921 [Caenorhabditis brenneri]|uniref:Uncharacterized protein n=1 Tax=Caenorhabditis brenneri TaxID=135651 RepID=G0P502_CAEBE|nr:hypothetical protein CAEBREN_12921 [Caenorhabditis brenneri]
MDGKQKTNDGSNKKPPVLRSRKFGLPTNCYRERHQRSEQKNWRKGIEKLKSYFPKMQVLNYRNAVEGVNRASWEDLTKMVEEAPSRRAKLEGSFVIFKEEWIGRRRRRKTRTSELC